MTAPNMEFVDDLMAAITSVAQTLGVFNVVTSHEPVNAVSGWTAALWLQDIAPCRGESGLNMTSLRVEFTFRIYSTAVTEPKDEVDPQLASATAKMIAALSAGFTFGDTVHGVDLLGAYGTPLKGKAGYLSVATGPYRVMDITIPVVVDDVFEQDP